MCFGKQDNHHPLAIAKSEGATDRSQQRINFVNVTYPTFVRRVSPDYNSAVNAVGDKGHSSVCLPIIKQKEARDTRSVFVRCFVYSC